MTRPRPSGVTWFVYDWGTVAVNPFFPEGSFVRVGEAVRFDVRLVVHDGNAARGDLEALYGQFLRETGA